MKNTRTMYHGHRLTAVFDAEVRLNVANCAGIAWLVDAPVQKMPRHHVLPDRGGRFSITSAPLGRTFDSLTRFRVKLIRPAG